MGMRRNGIAWRVAISLAVALVIAVAVRVATDPAAPVSTQPAVARVAGGSTLVTSADFKGVGATSPGAVVLRWWQANQFHEPAHAVAEFYAADSRPRPAQLRADVKLTEYIFNSTKPLVLDQRRTGGTAQVFTLIPPAGEAASSKDSTPYVFKLRSERGRWKLTDSYMADRAVAERRFARERRRR
jgi:hypothetical protein